MAYALKEKPTVSIGINEKIVYEKRIWLIFSWWVKVSTEKMSDDLIIEAPQRFEKIFLNGRELIYKPN